MNGVSAFLVWLVLLELATSESSVCEQRFSKKQFIITSKNYPNPYPGDLDCSYIIEGDGCARKYNFQFLDFDVEQDSECLKDFLEVGGLDRLCGAKSGVKSYYAPNGSLVLKFVTNTAVSGRGFQLLVTRLPCEPQKEDFYNLDWRQSFAGWNHKPAIEAKTPFCCRDTYNAKHFFLSSPGFPYSHNQPNDCVYHIHKANQNVCRLRLHVVYFSHGDFGEICSDNFLEIDGKRLCGCQSDVKLVVPFKSNAPKVFRFKNTPHHSDYSGFAIEVLQDECPWKYAPSRRQKRQLSIENAKLLYEDAEQSSDDGRVVRHFYFFSEPHEFGYDDDYPINERRDREETTYMDTSDGGFRLSDNDATQCAAFDFAQLAQNELWVQTSQCKANGLDCKELTDLRGYLHSPGYPYYYPGRLNLCYRFKKRPGYCAVRLAMVDFQIEYSNDCSKDYLLFGAKYRYCGQQLHNTVSTLDLTKAHFEDVIFVTDSHYCDRGFKAIYEQVPCMLNPTTTPPTQTPLVPCNTLMNEQEFVLNIFAVHQDTCIFTIAKSDSKVCRLELQTVVSNLDCNSEDVFVKGRSLCSLTESDSFSVDFKADDTIPIVYKRFSQIPSINALRVQLNVKQSSDNCVYDIPEVPAERLMSSSSDYGLFLELTNSTEDICGIIANTAFATSPQESCKVLMEAEMVKSCVPAETNDTELPDDVEKLQLLLSAKGKESAVVVQKVDCDYLLKVP